MVSPFKILSGWWKKFNQPFSSELPKMIVVGTIFFCLLFSASNISRGYYHYKQLRFHQHQALLLDALQAGNLEEVGQGIHKYRLETLKKDFALHRYDNLSRQYKDEIKDDRKNIRGAAIWVLIVSILMALEIVFLFLPPEVISRHYLLRKYRESQAKNFSAAGITGLLCITTIICLGVFYLMPGVYESYNMSKKEITYLEAIQSGTEAEINMQWRNSRDLFAKRLPYLDKEVTQRGWDYVYDTSKGLKEDAFFLLVTLWTLALSLVTKAGFSIYAAFSCIRKKSVRLVN